MTSWREVIYVTSYCRFSPISRCIGNTIVRGAEDTPVIVCVANDAADVVLTVSNDGNPIPEHLQRRVFEPFWRPPSSAPGGGLRLGLFICKQIVEAHSGTLEVVSTADVGACFTVRIPFISSSCSRRTRSDVAW
jgi:signal transduction histidine kinase